MNSPIIIGIGAGLVSAVLFASTLTGSVLAMALFYIMPLPVFLAGLGWGALSALIAALTGAALVSVLLMPLGGLGYFVAIGLPTAVLCYLALLSREAEPETGTETEAPAAGGNPAMEWYPPGRIVAWAALMAGTIAAISVPLMGADVESYRSAIEKLLDNTLLRQMPEGGPQGLDKQQLDAFVDLLVRVLPAASAIVWLAVMLLNMWVAGRIVMASGRDIRPWPDLSAMTYPGVLALGFVASLLLTFVPGMLSLVSTGFSGAFLLAYVILGLVVLHVLARKSPFRFILLATLYIGIFLFGWVALLVAIVGIGEPVFKLRQRAWNTPSGPPEDGA